MSSCESGLIKSDVEEDAYGLRPLLKNVARFDVVGEAISPSEPDGTAARIPSLVSKHDQRGNDDPAIMPIVG